MDSTETKTLRLKLKASEIRDTLKTGDGKGHNVYMRHLDWNNGAPMRVFDVRVRLGVLECKTAHRGWIVPLETWAA